MSLVYCDGFDSVSYNTELTRKYDTNQNITYYTRADGYKFGNAIQVSGAAIRPQFIMNSSGIIGCWFRNVQPLQLNQTTTFGIMGNADFDFGHLYASIAGPDYRVAFASQNNQTIYSDAYLSLNQWYHFEIQYQILNTTTIPCILKINGIEYARMNAGSDTSTTLANNNFRSFFKSPNTAACFDHFYILNFSGTRNNTFLGPGALVKDLYPISNGTINQWVPVPGTGENWDNVSEPFLDSNNYIQTSTSGNVDIYNMSAFTGTYRNILGVQNNVYVQQSGVDKLSLYSVARVSGVNYTSLITTGNYLPVSFTYKSNVIENNPLTNEPWTTGQLATSEFGVQLWHTGLGAGA